MQDERGVTYTEYALVLITASLVIAFALALVGASIGEDLGAVQTILSVPLP